MSDGLVLATKSTKIQIQGSLTTELHNMERQLLKSKARNGKSISEMVMNLINAKTNKEDFTILAEDEIDDAISTAVWDAYEEPKLEVIMEDIGEVDEDEVEDDCGQMSCATGKTGFWTTLSPMSMYSFRTKAAPVKNETVSVADENDDESLLHNIDTFEDRSKSSGSSGQFSKDLQEIIEIELEDKTSKRNPLARMMKKKLSLHQLMKGQTETSAPAMADVTPLPLKFSLPPASEADTESLPPTDEPTDEADTEWFVDRFDRPREKVKAQIGDLKRRVRSFSSRKGEGDKEDVCKEDVCEE